MNLKCQNVLCPNEMHKPDNINLKNVNKQTKNCTEIKYKATQEVIVV